MKETIEDVLELDAFAFNHNLQGIAVNQESWILEAVCEERRFWRNLQREILA